MEHYLLKKKPQVLKFEKLRKHSRFSKLITTENNKSLIYNHVGGLIRYLKMTNSENHKKMAIKLLQNIPNARCLVKEDLVNLYLVVDKYSISD